MTSLLYISLLALCGLASAQFPPATAGCAAALCPVGTICKETGIQCFRAPCPTVRCVPIDNKPGVCPRSDGLAGICIASCTTDADCKDNLKCCGGCPRECKTPLPNPPVTKPGKCPRPGPGFGPCVVNCNFDDDCGGNQKCCGSCPRDCTAPTPVNKPGKCPRPRPGFGPCVVNCNDDGDCDGNQKCCGSCPRDCTAPAPVVKPGFCPRSFSFWGSWGCWGQEPQCNNDGDCPGSMKCCNGCPRKCTPVNHPY